MKRTLAEDVWFINIGTDLKTSKESIGIASRYDGIFTSVGLHPHYIDEGWDADKYRGLAEHPKVVAIGECGLDNVRSSTSNILQRDIFKKQIELSLETNKPLMIHCRDSHDEVLGILKSYFINRKFYNGNVHFFSGAQEQAEQYLELGFTLSFTGVITFANDYDKIIKNLPLEKIMVETDAPFVAPVPYRGKRCEPLYVKETAKRIAEIKDVSYEEVARQTTQNAIDFFGLEHKM